MFGHTFYHKTLRKYVTLFGTLFNDVYINRADSTGTDIETLKVPIYYGPKNKALARLDQDPLLNRPAEQILPRMAFEMTGMSYDPNRKLVTSSKGFIKTGISGPNRPNYVYNPVPYTMEFSLYIMVKNAEDGTRILEQILPFFTPEWTTTVNLIGDVDAKMDIPVIIGSVSSEDTYEGAVGERRTIIWTLNFTMKGYLFGPVRKPTGEVITLAKVNFFEASRYDNVDDAVGNLPIAEWTSIEPGMMANGAPTSNASLSVPRNEITPNSNYSYIFTSSPSYGYSNTIVVVEGIPYTMDDDHQTIITFDTTDITIDFSSESDTF